MKRSMTFITASALLLAGCGGSSGSGDVGALPPSFIVWARSSGGGNVIDGPGHVFAFFSDTRCLFSTQTGRENTACCLSPSSNFVNYGAFQGKLVNVWSMYAKHHQPAVPLLVYPRTDIGNGADAVDAGVCPEIDKHDFSLQLRRGQRC